MSETQVMSETPLKGETPLLCHRQCRVSYISDISDFASAMYETPVTRVTLDSSCIVSESADSAAGSISAVSEALMIFLEIFEAALSYV